MIALELVFNRNSGRRSLYRGKDTNTVAKWEQIFFFNRQKGTKHNFAADWLRLDYYQACLAENCLKMHILCGHILHLPSSTMSERDELESRLGGLKLVRSAPISLLHISIKGFSHLEPFTTWLMSRLFRLNYWSISHHLRPLFDAFFKRPFH